MGGEKASSRLQAANPIMWVVARQRGRQCLVVAGTAVPRTQLAKKPGLSRSSASADQEEGLPAALATTCSVMVGA